MKFANNIKSLQEAKNWTIPQAAKAMGMSYGGYLKLARGENQLTSTTITRAAKVFDVAEEEVLATAPAKPGASGSVLAVSIDETLRALDFKEAMAAEIVAMIEQVVASNPPGFRDMTAEETTRMIVRQLMSHILTRWPDRR